MALWDAFSGKVWHWNSTRLEVHKLVFPRLQLYDRELHVVRDLLFASYYAFFDTFGRIAFSDEPELRARNYASRIKAINRNGFLSLVSGYTCNVATRLFASNDDQDLSGLGVKLIVDANRIYGRDQLYTAQRLEVYSRSDTTLSAALLSNEVASVLGLDARSDWEMNPWIESQERVAALTLACYQQDGWNLAVTRDLSRPVRFGGYADSIVR
jgi:hypothetical protein